MEGVMVGVDRRSLAGVGALPGNGAGREMWGKGELCFGPAKCVVSGGQPGRGAGQAAGPASTLVPSHSQLPQPKPALPALVPKATSPCSGQSP